jgi:hypothetical protein
MWIKWVKRPEWEIHPHSYRSAKVLPTPQKQQKVTVLIW